MVFGRFVMISLLLCRILFFVPFVVVVVVVFFLIIRRPPRSTQSRSSAASDVYKRQILEVDAVMQNLKEVVEKNGGHASFPIDRLLIVNGCLLYTSPSPRDRTRSRMPSSA